MSKSSKKSGQKLKQTSSTESKLKETLPKYIVAYDSTSGRILGTHFSESQTATHIEVVGSPEIINQYGVPTKRVVDGVLVDRLENEVNDETAQKAQQLLRIRRDKRLAKTDFTQSLDVPLSSEIRAAWAAYRQALRDLPSQISDAQDFEWPIPPATPKIPGVNNA